MSDLPLGFNTWSADDQSMYLRGSKIEAIQSAMAAQSKRNVSELHAMMLTAERIFCTKIKHLREKQGWSQADLAQQLAAYGFDLHQTTIAKLEAGKRPLRVAELYALGMIFKLPPGAIFFMETYAGDLPAMDELDRRLSELEAMREEARQQTLSVIESLADSQSMFEYSRQQLIREMTGMNRSGGNDGEHPEAP